MCRARRLPTRAADNLARRHPPAGFGESVDAFPLPKGYSENPELQAHPAPGAVAGAGSDDPFNKP